MFLRHWSILKFMAIRLVCIRRIIPITMKLMLTIAVRTNIFPVFAKTICLKGDLYDYYVAQLTWNPFELTNAYGVAI